MIFINTTANVGVMTLAVGALSKGLTMLSNSTLGGVITIIVGIGLLILYEKLPSSTPTA